MPTPHGFKGKIVRFLTTNEFIWFVMKVHLAACFLAAFFYWDLNETEVRYTEEKERLKLDGSGMIGTGIYALI